MTSESITDNKRKSILMRRTTFLCLLRALRCKVTVWQSVSLIFCTSLSVIPNPAIPSGPALDLPLPNKTALPHCLLGAPLT